MVNALNACLGDSIKESIAVKQAVLEQMLNPLATAAQWMAETPCGVAISFCSSATGGSAVEFIGRFERERRALPAIALTTDTSILTALGNDYGTKVIFAQQVEALGQSSDLALAERIRGH